MPTTTQSNEHIPEQAAQITVFQYSPDAIAVLSGTGLYSLWQSQNPGVTWIHSSGPPDSDFLDQLAAHYNLHPLSIEDVIHSGQRSKLETYDEYLFLSLYALDAETQQRLEVNMFVGGDYVITLMPDDKGLFAPVQEMLKHGNSNLRKMGSDFLCYSLCDRIIDSVFPVLEQLGKEVFEIEDQIFSLTRDAMASKLHHLRVRLWTLERDITGAQEVIEDIRTGEIALIKESTLVYLRDCYDHTLQQLHSTEAYRQITASILESYLSLANNEMNEVIKVLTVISTIFIPLTFITSVYGMNFTYMPELGHRFGYPGVWILMIAVTAGLLMFYRRKNWL